MMNYDWFPPEDYQRQTRVQRPVTRWRSPEAPPSICCYCKYSGMHPEPPLLPLLLLQLQLQKALWSPGVLPVGREAAVRSVGTKERLIKRDPPVGRSLSAPRHTAVGTRPNFRPALIRDSALTRDLDTESERTASTADSELPAAGSTRRLFRMSPARSSRSHPSWSSRECNKIRPTFKIRSF